MQYLKLLKLLPEIVGYMKILKKKLDQGITLAQIKKAQKRINDAFESGKDEKIVDDINDIWRG